MVPHIARRDLPHTAWLQALAYATTSTNRSGERRRHPRAWARAAWLGIFAAHWIMGHRNLYLTRSRLGVVSFYQHPPLGMIARGAVFLAPLIAASFSTSPLLGTTVTIPYLVVLASMTTSVSLTGRRSKAASGTPKIAKPRGHYVIGLAAAHPNAPSTETSRLALTLMRQLIPGEAVVVHPRTEKLRGHYERAGFRPSKGLEMVLHVR